MQGTDFWGNETMWKANALPLALPYPCAHRLNHQLCTHAALCGNDGSPESKEAACLALGIKKPWLEEPGRLSACFLGRNQACGQELAVAALRAQAL